MPAKRIIASLVIKGGIVVQSIGFERFLPVGRADIAARFLDDWGVDEILLLDIEASAEGRLVSLDLVEAVSKSCFVPITVGGGIRGNDDIQAVLHSGADKIAVNRLAFTSPETVHASSRLVGCQCIVASMDARGREVFTGNGRNPTGQTPADYAQMLEEFGAGEILVNSIDNDGAKTGYDLELVQEVADAVSVPVIALGGAGHLEHFAQVLAIDGVSAAAAGNFFHFTEHSVAVLKAQLGGEVRMESVADYRDSAFLEDGRIGKKADGVLAEQIFDYLPEEGI